MRIVEQMRRRGVKPRSVRVWLTPQRSHAWENTGVVTLMVGPEARLSEIDFRPLVGLDVVLVDAADAPDRAQRVRSLLLAASPASLASVIEGDGEVVMQVVRGAECRRMVVAA